MENTVLRLSNLGYRINRIKKFTAHMRKMQKD